MSKWGALLGDQEAERFAREAGHSLGRLRDKLVDLLTHDGVDAEWMEAFDVLFVELDEVDPTGVSFRYYRRLDGRLSLASASGMPLRYLATDGLARKVDELDVFLDGMRDEFDLREWSFSDMLMDHSM